MKHTLKYKLLAISAFAPALTFAYLNNLKTLIGDIGGIILLIKPIVMTLAIVYFFWGVGQFVLKDAGNDKTREDGKKKMLWGVIALFVMYSIFGILNLISGTLGVPTTAPAGTTTSGGGNFGVDCNQNPNTPPC